MAVRICFAGAAVLLLTTTLAATPTSNRVQLVRSALDDDTTLIGEPVVFTCSITDGMLLEWKWIDESNSDGEKIRTYVPDNHRVCGEREPYTPGAITTAEIYSVLAVVVNTSDDTANCTSLLEVKPTAGFSSVNISCAGQFKNGPGTVTESQILPLNSESANVLLLTSTIEGGIINTNRSATFTCGVSAKSLQWSYKRKDMSTPVVIETHNTTDPLCDDKNQHPDIINHTDIFTLLATNDNAGNIISILEITHRSVFTGVTVYCTAAALDGNMVEKNFTFDIIEPTMTQPATTTQDQATSSSVATDPTTTTTIITTTTTTTQEQSSFLCGGGPVALAAILFFVFGLAVGVAITLVVNWARNNRPEAEDANGVNLVDRQERER